MSTQNEIPAASPWHHPTQLEILADIASGNRELPDYTGATRPYTVNIPLPMVMLIEALHINTKGISLNEFICQLLDLAIDEVREKLPEEIKEHILYYVSVQMDSSNDKLLKFK